MRTSGILPGPSLRSRLGDWLSPGRKRSREKPRHAEDGLLPNRRVAYVVSEYPKVSHSFIRREILALERRGWRILRVAMRGWDSILVDPADIQERNKTLFVLKGGMLPLAGATLRALVTAPGRFFAALSLAVQMMHHSDRPFVWHLIYLAEACWMLPHLKRQQIDHLHAHFGTNPAEVAMLASALIGGTYSLTVHGPEEFDRAPSIHLREKIRRAELVVAISSFGRSQLFRLVGQESWEKIQVVHCGIDRTFSDETERDASGSRRLVCVGRLCEQKGQLLLVKAAALLAAEGRAFELVLVGDGEHRPMIEALIARLDLGSHVRVTGWASADQVKSEMLAARALILPSFAEGLPVVLMEAMALGRPVLTTYVAGIPELVIDGETGWLFPAGSIDDMLAAMRACLDSPEEKLERMGRAARIRALERHDIDGQAARLSDLLASISGGPGHLAG
ncbi:MAG TPA: glycosyltransferase family 4 protein [Rhizomicrobium sp.]|nr:glycosyltransferase family 4 protein [Rhizomicrobium sp.]